MIFFPKVKIQLFRQLLDSVEQRMSKVNLNFGQAEKIKISVFQHRWTILSCCTAKKIFLTSLNNNKNIEYQ